jgi:hypothetical protein
MSNNKGMFPYSENFKFDLAKAAKDADMGESENSDYEETTNDESTADELNNEKNSDDANSNNNNQQKTNKRKGTIPHRLKRSQKGKTAVLTHRRHHFAFTFQEEIYITIEAQREGNKTTVASKYGISSRHIRYWESNMEKMKEKAEKNPNAKTTNKGRKVENAEIEKK